MRKYCANMPDIYPSLVSYVARDDTNKMKDLFGDIGYQEPPKALAGAACGIYDYTPTPSSPEPLPKHIFHIPLMEASLGSDEAELGAFIHVNQLAQSLVKHITMMRFLSVDDNTRSLTLYFITLNANKGARLYTLTKLVLHTYADGKVKMLKDLTTIVIPQRLYGFNFGLMEPLPATDGGATKIKPTLRTSYVREMGPLLEMEVLSAILLSMMIAMELNEMYALFKQRKLQTWRQIGDMLFGDLIDYTLIVIGIVIISKRYSYMQLTARFHAKYGLRTTLYEYSVENLVTYPGESINLGEIIQDFSKASQMQNEVETLWIVLFVLLICEVMMSVSFSPRMHVMVDTMATSSIAMAPIFVIFFVLLVGYSIVGMVLFGPQIDDFSTFGQALQMNLLFLTDGGLDYASLYAVHAAGASFYYWTFSALMVILILNMVLAIIFGVYDDQRERIQDDQVDFMEMIKGIIMDPVGVIASRQGATTKLKFQRKGTEPDAGVDAGAGAGGEVRAGAHHHQDSTSEVPVRLDSPVTSENVEVTLSGM